MPENVRFAVAVHVLVLLALTEAPVTSAYVAESVGTHPVVIRRILARLRRAGLVTGRAGPRGGFRLARPPRSIRLSRVYAAVEEGGAGFPGHRPNSRCPVGRHVSEVIGAVGRRAESAFLASLSRDTLASAVRRVRRLAGPALS